MRLVVNKCFEEWSELIELYNGTLRETVFADCISEDLREFEDEFFPLIGKAPPFADEASSELDLIIHQAELISRT